MERGTEDPWKNQGAGHALPHSPILPLALRWRERSSILTPRGPQRGQEQAERGGGAFLNEKQITASPRDVLAGAEIVLTGFGRAKRMTDRAAARLHDAAPQYLAAIA
mgnify:CR=1 FL=1